MIWVDFETNPSTGCSWADFSYAQNCEYLQELITAISANGRKPGIYASHYMWVQIFGSASACQNFTHIPLWYAHYDNVQSFSDFNANPFGGWTKPAIKQFDDGMHQKICGITVDQDWYP